MEFEISNHGNNYISEKQIGNIISNIETTEQIESILFNSDIKDAKKWNIPKDMSSGIYTMIILKAIQLGCSELVGD